MSCERYTSGPHAIAPRQRRYEPEPAHIVRSEWTPADASPNAPTTSPRTGPSSRRRRRTGPSPAPRSTPQQAASTSRACLSYSPGTARARALTAIHSAVFALWNAPIQRFGLLHFGFNASYVIPKSDVERTLFGTARRRWWSWSQFSRSAHCERPAGDASPCAMARADLTAPRTSISCRLLRTSSRLSVLFIE